MKTWAISISYCFSFFVFIFEMLKFRPAPHYTLVHRNIMELVCPIGCIVRLAKDHKIKCLIYKASRVRI